MIWLIIIMVSIALFQVPPLLRRKQWRELLGFGLIWLSAIFYASLVVMDFPLPSIMDILNFTYAKTASAFESLLGYLGF